MERHQLGGSRFPEQWEEERCRQVAGDPIQTEILLVKKIRVCDPVFIELEPRYSCDMPVGEQDIGPFVAPVVYVDIDRDSILIYVVIAAPGGS